MGTSIGPITASLVAAKRTPPAIEATGQRSRPAFDLIETNSQGNTSSPASTSSSLDAPRAGFGPGTVSGPAAALVALGRGVRAAREAIPTLDEIREQFQANRASHAAEAAVSEEARRAVQPEDIDSEGTRRRPADALTFNRFTEALGFSQPQSDEPVRLASARPPEAVQFASAEQLSESVTPVAEPAESGPVPEALQRRRLDLTV